MIVRKIQEEHRHSLNDWTRLKDNSSRVVIAAELKLSRLMYGPEYYVLRPFPTMSGSLIPDKSIFLAPE